MVPKWAQRTLHQIRVKLGSCIIYLYKYVTIIVVLFIVKKKKKCRHVVCRSTAWDAFPTKQTKCVAHVSVISTVRLTYHTNRSLQVVFSSNNYSRWSLSLSQACFVKKRLKNRNKDSLKKYQMWNIERKATWPVPKTKLP